MHMEAKEPLKVLRSKKAVMPVSTSKVVKKQTSIPPKTRCPFGGGEEGEGLTPQPD